MRKHNKSLNGFTIVELIIVVVVIAILASLVIVAYNGVQEKAHDKALLSDISAVESELTLYSTKHSGKFTTALEWDSSTGQNTNIKFIPSPGNTIIVTANDTDYCIKAYNPNSNKKTLESAEIKESSANACADISNPPPDPFEVELSGTTFTANEITTICSSTANAPAGYNLINGSGVYVVGTSGNDIIYQASSIGYIYGGAGNDIMCVGSSAGYVYGGDGNDIIRVESGIGYIYGDAGNDTVWSVANIAVLGGGDGDDVLYVHQNITSVNGGNGYDKLHVEGGIVNPGTTIEEIF